MSISLLLLINALGYTTAMLRTALVTGASRGLGAAMATALAEGGYSVAVNFFANRDRAYQHRTTIGPEIDWRQ